MAGLTGLPRRSRKALQVPLPRKKKVQEPQAAPLERLPDAQKDQIVSHAVLRRHAADGTAKRHELPWVMSKFLNLGLALDEVVAMATVEPAKIIGRVPGLGTLQIGAPADISIFDL